MVGGLNLFKSRRYPIGVDLGTGRVKMLQLADGAQGLKVIAGSEHELPIAAREEGPERRAELIEGCRRLLNHGPFRGREAVALVPDHLIRFKNVRMPKMPPAELAQAVHWEAAEQFDSGDEPMVLQHLVAGDVHQGQETRQEVVVMGAADATIEAYLQVLTAAGLRPVALDATPTALARAFSRTARRQSDREAVHLCVDVGHWDSKVLILRGGRVMFYRRVGNAGHALNQAVAEQLEITEQEAERLRHQRASGGPNAAASSEADAGEAERAAAVDAAVRDVSERLAKEINLCLRYYSVTFRGERPHRIWLCGGGAHEPGLAETLGRHVELEATAVQPLRDVDLSHEAVEIDRRRALPEWMLATGLSLRREGSEAEGTRDAA